MKPLSIDTQEDTQSHDRPNQGTSNSVPYRRSSDGHSGSQSDMAGTSVIHSHSSTEQSSKPSTHVPTRRRIQVACSRCRRRKIRCSGDTGNGQGCTNCKSSGTSSCIFVRVNSSPLQPGLTLPYGLLKSADSSRGSWESQAYFRANSISVHSGSHLSSDSSPSDFDYGSTTQSPVYHRPQYSSEHPLAYDESSMAYSMHAPSYMLPSADIGAVSSLYAGSNNLRSWSSTAQTLRPSTALYCDPETPASLGYSFPPNSSVQASTLADHTPMFGTATGIASGLPLDRTLPNPATSRNNPQHFPATITETLPNANSGNQGQRISHLLSAECQLSLGDRDSSRIPQRADASSQDTKGTSLCQSRDIGFGYVQTVEMPDGIQSSDSERSKRDDLLYSSDTFPRQ
ncbi:hypothetical protein VTO42DRAFT_3678 [Malbranchea cinnamomea]